MAGMTKTAPGLHYSTQPLTGDVEKGYSEKVYPTDHGMTPTGELTEWYNPLLITKPAPEL